MNELAQRCRDCLVRDTSLCSSLCDDELVVLSEIGRRKTIPAGGVIAWAGDDNALCANVVTGALKVQASTQDGREQTVGLLFPGDFVGHPFSDHNMLTTEALMETDLCIYPRAAFERVLTDRPKLERALLERTMKSLDEARARQLTLTRLGAQAKVASFITDLARAHRGDTVILPMSRRDIGDYLGLSIETVSRQLTELRSLGLIDGDRGAREIRILDREGLQALSE